jgi:propanediol dehydratase small subunit
MQYAADKLRAGSGRPIENITLEALSQLADNDLQVSGDTLRAQASIALQAGYPQLAANLTRAAELTAVPNEELLKMYDLLRPGRASFETLIALAERLETTYNAPFTGQFVREAAEAYRVRNLLRRQT